MLRDIEPADVMNAEADEGILDLTFGGESDAGELDLTLGTDEASASEKGFEQTAVNLDIDDGAEPAPDFETVQLRPDDLARVGIISPEMDADTLDDGSVEVDRDFAGVFGGEGGDLEDELAELDIEFPDSAFAAEQADVPNASDVELFDELSDSSVPGRGAAEDDAQFEKTQFMLRDIAAITADPEHLRHDDDDDENRTLVLGRGANGGSDEMQTKLDLAQAYIDMGDVEGARGILGEVMAEGDDAQQSVARDLLAKLS
jgi:pilus assembly protein FimV